MNQSTLIGLLFWAATSLTAQSQPCGEPQSQLDLHGNSIRARMLNGGDLFTDTEEGQFLPDYEPGQQNPSTIFAAGLWIGGLDPGGNLKLATASYRYINANDYWPGPLDPQTGTTADAVCGNWDRLFKVTKTEVNGFLAALPGLTIAEAIAQFPSVMGWPGQGNPHFVVVAGFDLPFTNQGLAPFFDANGDAVYDPMDGDYPVVQLQGKAPFLPDEMIWCVFNDEGGGSEHAQSGGDALQIEVQLTAWAFASATSSVLDHTVFTAHKIINRSTEQIDSCHVGLWVDFDLGCYSDDYVGCEPGLNTFFCYNQDAVDGQPGASCAGTPTFAEHPPVQSTTFLSHTLDYFIYNNSASVGNAPAATTDADQPIEFYNYLTGRWRDGTPITAGGDGYQGGGAPTNYAFPGDPGDPQAWTMCTANLPFNDRRVIGSARLPQMGPGAVNELVTAWTTHFNTPPPCNLGNTLNEIAELQECYDNNFDFPNCLLVGTQTPATMPVAVFPNPATASVTLDYGDWQVQVIRLYDAMGRLVQLDLHPGSRQTVLEAGSLPDGFYTAILRGESRSGAARIVVMR